MSAALAIAAEAFERTLEELDLETDLGDDPAALGRRAALLAAADSVWKRHLGPMFDAEKAKVVLGVSSRQAVSDLAKRGRLLAIDAAGGRKRYPAFQFGQDGRPYPELPAILEIFADVVETPHTVASWLVSPNSALGNETPIVWMRSGREPRRLRDAARRSAERLAH
ncbi:MAG: DUF2384 domain-containing protein [bacterium]|nr:DUF2384 domain-containing protein [bacterium]